MSSTALYDFFAGLGPVSSSQYIMFEVNAFGSGGGAWCSDNADFYVNNYLSFSSNLASLISGNWTKYWRSNFESWSGPDTAAYWNYFGANCDSSAYSWCSEWGIGGLYLGLMPGQFSSSSSYESYSNGVSGGQGWVVSVAVGADRLSTCGF